MLSGRPEANPADAETCWWIYRNEAIIGGGVGAGRCEEAAFELKIAEIL
jgi:hypothetical protein